MTDQKLEQQLKDLKSVYQQIETPENLTEAVHTAIEQAPVVRKFSFARQCSKYAACFLLGLGLVSFGALNISPSFALAAADLPIVGPVAQLLTLRQYEQHDLEKNLSASIPNVDNMTDKAFQEIINQEIQARMDEAINLASQDAQERREAFLATGGKEDDFSPVEIKADYQIFSQSPEILSFVVRCRETQAQGTETSYYYNLDITANQTITLEDMLGKDHQAIINQQITQEIANREKADPKVQYFHNDGMGFQGIAPNQNFYINKAGHVVVVFEQYEIAPGFMGQQTFEILPE